MFAVIFEVQPRPERFDEYLELAAQLKPELQRIDGFIDVKRYRSQRSESRVLSLSIWRDDKAVIRWRTHAVHHQAQEKGRREIFRDYRLRVGEVAADTGLAAGETLSQQRFDASELGVVKAVTITELAPGYGDARRPTELATELRLPDHAGVVDREVFESIYNPGKLLLLAGWKAEAAAGGPGGFPKSEPGFSR